MKCLMPMGLNDFFCMTINGIDYIPLFSNMETLIFLVKKSNTLSIDEIYVDSENADDLIRLAHKHGRKVAIIHGYSDGVIEYQELVED